MGEYEDQLGRIAAERQEIEMPVAVERQQRGRDLIPTAFITPNQAVDENGNDIVVTKSGAVRTVPYDPSEVEATVNLLPETFQTGIGNWGSDNSTRVWIYDRSMTVVPNGSVGSLVAYSSVSNMPLWPVGQVATWSIDFTNDTGVQVNAYCTLRPYNATPAVISPDINGTSIVVEPYETKRLTVTAVAPATSQFVRLMVRWGRVGGGLFTTSQTANLKNPQFEWEDHATPYVHPMSNYVYWLGTVTNSPSARLPEHPDRYQEATTNIDTNPVARDVKRSVNAVPGTSSSRIDNAGLDHPTAGRINTATRVTVTTNLAETTWIGKPFTVTPAVGDTFSSQVWFRVSKGLIGKAIQYRLSKNGGTSERSFVFSQIATGEWQYFRNVLNVTTTGGTGMFDDLAFPDAIGNAAYVGEYVDFTATQLELKPYSTPLVDINSPDVTWAGTPFASASSRPTRQDPLRGVGYFIEESETNYIRNPHFVGFPSTWNTQNATAVAIPSSRMVDGGRVLNELIVTASTNPSILYTIPSPVDYAVNPGDSVTLSWHVLGLGSAIGKTVRIRVIFRTGLINIGDGVSTDLVLDGTEQVVIVTGIAPENADNYYCLFYANSSSMPNSMENGERVVVWAPQAVKRAYNTSFVPLYDFSGNLMSGYSWNGAPHSAPSFRVYSSMSISASYMAAISPFGAIYQRAYRPLLYPDGFIRRSLRSGPFTNTGFLSFADGFVVGESNVQIHNGVSSNTIANTLNGVEYWTPFSRVINLRNTFFEVFTNGLKVGQAQFPAGPSVINSALNIGGFGSTQASNTLHAAVILFNRPLSDAEIAYLDSIPTHALTFENVRRVDFWESDDG